jgi:hypothetical protein
VWQFPHAVLFGWFPPGGLAGFAPGVRPWQLLHVSVPTAVHDVAVDSPFLNEPWQYTVQLPVRLSVVCVFDPVYDVGTSLHAVPRASAPNVIVARAPFVPLPVACVQSPFAGTAWHSLHAIVADRYTGFVRWPACAPTEGSVTADWPDTSTALLFTPGAADVGAADDTPDSVRSPWHSEHPVCPPRSAVPFTCVASAPPVTVPVVDVVRV